MDQGFVVLLTMLSTVCQYTDLSLFEANYWCVICVSENLDCSEVRCEVIGIESYEL